MQSHNSSMVFGATKNADFKVIEFLRFHIMSRKAEVKNASLFTLHGCRYFFLMQTYKRFVLPLQFLPPSQGTVTRDRTAEWFFQNLCRCTHLSHPQSSMSSLPEVTNKRFMCNRDYNLGGSWKRSLMGSEAPGG